MNDTISIICSGIALTLTTIAVLTKFKYPVIAHSAIPVVMVALYFAFI